jgi:hypothetical protein
MAMETWLLEKAYSGWVSVVLLVRNSANKLWVAW